MLHTKLFVSLQPICWIETPKWDYANIVASKFQVVQFPLEKHRCSHSDHGIFGLFFSLKPIHCMFVVYCINYDQKNLNFTCITHSSKTCTCQTYTPRFSMPVRCPSLCMLSWRMPTRPRHPANVLVENLIFSTFFLICSLPGRNTDIQIGTCR